MPLPLLVLLRQAWDAALKNWRVLLIILALGAVGLYVRNAEKAKQDLAEVKRRAAAAESLYSIHAGKDSVLGKTADSLRTVVKDTDANWQAVVNRLRSRPPRRDTVLVNRGGSPDSTTQSIPDSLPPVKADTSAIDQLIAACDLRVAARDDQIRTLDLRHANDSLTINDLRKLVPGAVLLPPKEPSRLNRVLATTAAAALGAVAGQQLSGQKGLIVGSTLGALIGLIR